MVDGACSSILPIGRDERGANLVEYMVIVGCVALVALGGYARFGASVEQKISAQADCVTSLACNGNGADGSGEGNSAGTTTSTAASYVQQLDQSLATLTDQFAAIAGDDGRIDTDDLRAALNSSDPAVQAAAQFFLDNPSALHALDVGSGHGDVDGHISREDIAGLQQSIAAGQLPNVLADTADGEGSRDGNVSRDDLQALLDDPGIPPELRDWATDQLANMPEEHHGCSGIDLGCRASSAFHSAWHLGTDTLLPFALDYTPLGFQVGLARGVFSTVTSLGWAVTHPIDAAQGLNYAIAHPVETLWTFGDSIRAGIAESPAQGLGMGTWDIGSFFIPGAGESRAVLAATTAASQTSNVLSVSTAGDDASTAHVPGWVSTIDDAVVIANPVLWPARIGSWIFG